MNKVLVIYFSKYGTTKQYSEWIASDLKGDICGINNSRKIDLSNHRQSKMLCELNIEDQ